MIAEQTELVAVFCLMAAAASILVYNSPRDLFARRSMLHV
jgi:hypothetical protein